MFRKLMFSSITAMGFLVPAAMPSEAAAGGGVSIRIGYSSGYGSMGIGYSSGIGYPAYYPPAVVPPAYLPPVYTPLPYLPPVHVHGCWKVMYRTCIHSPWVCYRTLECRYTAYQLCERLRYAGYEARVVGHAH